MFLEVKLKAVPILGSQNYKNNGDKVIVIGIVYIII